MMTKKDFIALADAICYHNEYCPHDRPFNDDHFGTLAAFCRSCNPRFNRERWLDYIRGECSPNGGRVRKPKGNTR